jgi:5'-nucleotidase / UDP-sugar diphosphatase
MARRATAIKLERDKATNVLLLDAGNALFGQDLADQSNGKAVVEAMNKLGYDAMGLGSIDLTQGTTTLYDRAKDAKFPFLSANVIDSTTNQPIGKPYVVVTVGGRKIALVGLSGLSQDTQGTAVSNVTEKDPIATARDVIAQANKETNAVIVLSTLGFDMEKALAEQAPGIAVIVGGDIGDRTPELTTAGPNGTVILRAQIDGEELGSWKMTIDPDGKATNVQGGLVTLLNDSFAEDADMQKLLDGFKQP